jgi:DNA-binding NarL/FixJ family response regulator
MNCQLLKDALTRSRAPLKVIACALSSEDVALLLKAHDCQVALIADSLSDGPLSGFRALRELRHSFPKIRPVLLMKSHQEDLVIDAFRTGAKGVFCRTEPIKALTKCITAVHQGQVWANSAQLNSLLTAFAQVAPLQIATSRGNKLLTKRENDVAKHVVQGFSNREASQKLGLTEHTVSNYLFRIYDKLGISSRVELVLYWIENSHP